MGGCRKSFEEYAKQIIYLIMSYDKIRIYYQGYDERSRTYRTKKYTINLNKATIEHIERYGLNNNISIAYWVYGFEIRERNGNVLLTKNDHDLEVKDIERWEWLSSTDTKKDEPKAEPKKETPKPQPAPAPKAEPKAEPKKEAPKAQPTQKIEITESVVNGKTAFIFNGETYTVKGKLCHAIAKYYIEQNPDITISQLRETFNIKNVNAVESVEDAIKTTDSSGTPGGSYYMKDADQIETKEGKVVVWNYWPERYYTPFMEIVEKLNFVSSGDKAVKETPKAQPAPAPKAEPKKEAPKPEVRRPSADDMNVLDKLIDAALEDFVLTDEERSVLLKKSKEIGLGEDEFKIYLNGKIQERMKDKPAEKVEEKKKGFFARLFG